MRCVNARKKRRRNADLGKNGNEKRTRLDEEESGKRKNFFLLVFSSVITRTHFPEEHCTC